MKTECSLVRDLLPLYVEQMVSEDTARYVEEHVKDCPACQAELATLRKGASVDVADADPQPTSLPDHAKPFKKMMKRMNRQFSMLAYSLIIFFVFLGFSWTDGENLMYNSLIMPIVGVFGYYVFRWRAIYKMPILLLIIDLFVCLFKLVDLDLESAVLWTMLYSAFVLVGIVIAFLLHYAFRKENET